MGGSAFSSGASPLFTPRMPKSIYEAAKRRCHEALQELYSCVESPIDGPGKKDFGDVDVLVALPKTQASSGDDELDTISYALDAKQIIKSRGKGMAANLAIPWPSSDTKEPLRLGSESEILPGLHDRHIQVDVQVCDTTEKVGWILFKHGHGDLWNLVGSMIRRYGLTVDESAMWLRVPEIEESNRKRAKVFLSSTPADVLHFLGLPKGEYWDRPFNDLQEMYEYAARCRLMYVPPVEEEESDAKKVKSRDGRRTAHRPAFKQWVEEFLPQCRQLGRFGEKKTTREEVTKEALAHFNVEEEYNSRRDEFLLERQKDYIWNHSIKGNVPKAENPDARASLYRSCLVKALKRIILEGDESYGLLLPDNLKDPKGHFIMGNVADFITKFQKEVGDAAMARHAGFYAEHMRNKLSQPTEG